MTLLCNSIFERENRKNGNSTLKPRKKREKKRRKEKRERRKEKEEKRKEKKKASDQDQLLQTTTHKPRLFG